MSDVSVGVMLSEASGVGVGVSFLITQMSVVVVRSLIGLLSLEVRGATSGEVTCQYVVD